MPPIEQTGGGYSPAAVKAQPERSCPAPQAPPGAAGLGNNAINVHRDTRAPITAKLIESPSQAKRATLWRIKEAGWDFLPERAQKCMRVRIQGAVEVATYQNDKGGTRACYRGLVTCANLNACPICAHRIKTVRALELGEQLDAWADHHGGKNAVSLLTLTIRHHQGHRLAPMVKKLQKAQRALWNRLNRQTKRLGGKSQCEAWGLVGTVRALETTSGQNGWHPHAHTLICWESPKKKAELAEVEKLVSSVWRECVRKYVGAEHEPDMAHGVDLRGGASAGAYLLKLAFEASDPVAKVGREINGEKGRSPFQLLDDAGKVDGDGDPLDEKAGQLFLEFVAAMKGARLFEYSRRGDFKRNLRRLAKQDEEKTDEELAGDRGSAVLSLTAETWARVAGKRGARAKLLSMVEHAGAAGGVRWLKDEGLFAKSAEQERAEHEELWKMVTG